MSHHFIFFTRSGVLKNGEILFYENFYGFLFFFWILPDIFDGFIVALKIFYSQGSTDGRNFIELGEKEVQKLENRI